MNVMADLEQRLSRMVSEDPRTAAEYAFAIATLKRREGDREGVAGYARRAMEFFNSVPTGTLDDCAARNITIEGLVIPDLIHEDGVREGFKDIL
jgi:hypothetical protein